MTSKISFYVTLLICTLFAGLVGTANAAPMLDGVSASSFYVAQQQPNKRQEPEFQCKNKLANWIYQAGFRGENIREAWAIAMRESNGSPTEISPSNDFGLFQINAGAWSGQSWWDSQSMLDPVYNARIAYKISKGGKSWVMWGLDGQGNTAAYVYSSYGWSQWQIDNWITIPYQKYYVQFPCKV